MPIHIAERLSEAKVKAYRIADNRTHEEAEWDEELLALELGDLKDLDFYLDLTGFDPDELDKLLSLDSADGLTDEDSIPEVEGKAVSQLGDLWCAVITVCCVAIPPIPLPCKSCWQDRLPTWYLPTRPTT